MKPKQTFIATLIIKTDEGDFLASYSGAGLSRLEFPRGSTKSVDATASATKEVRRWHEWTTRAVQQALAGKSITHQPPVDLSAGTVFQRKVWAALQAIPVGKTETYSGVALAVRKPKAARAVGAACGANPVPLLVPCHRVVAAGGGIGGFSSGLPWKRKLLGREGIGGRLAD